MKRILLILVGTGLLLSLAELDREGAGPTNGREIIASPESVKPSQACDEP